MRLLYTIRGLARQDALKLALVAVGIFLVVRSSTKSKTSAAVIENPPPQPAVKQQKEMRAHPKADEFVLEDLNDKFLDFSGSNKALRKPKDRAGNKDKFDFTIPKLEDKDDFTVSKMWKCSDSTRTQKLVALHIPGTVDVKRLLRKYADKCHAGYAAVGSCIGVSPDSLENGDWRFRKDSSKKCKMQKAIQRDGKERNDVKYVRNTFLEKHVDILYGDVSVGVDYSWHDDKGANIQAQYVAFIRHPLTKYVMETLSRTPKEDVEKAVKFIKEQVAWANDKDIHFVKYPSSFITPKEKATWQDYGFDLSHGESVGRALHNILDRKVLVGIVERMEESMEMLQYVMDRDGALAKDFESFKAANDNESFPFEIDDVVKELKKDEDFMKEMKVFLKYETQFYNFCLDLHKKQYATLPKSKAEDEK